uniref:Uncharacterized protein n=1 Tax=Oryza brachyantha TaxID=4533 RepID=J3L6L3_ORYBR
MASKTTQIKLIVNGLNDTVSCCYSSTVEWRSLLRTSHLLGTKGIYYTMGTYDNMHPDEVINILEQDTVQKLLKLATGIGNRTVILNTTRTHIHVRADARTEATSMQ